MKKLQLFLILSILVTNLTFAQNSISKAEEFIKQLENDSSKIHGIPLNVYLILDIDHDNTFEVIERINQIENNAIGLLNIEIAKAFEFDKIYKLSDGEYVENYNSFQGYLSERLEHYLLWKRLIENPVNLNSDSQNLIKKNKTEFLQEINRLIHLTEEKIN